MVRVTTECITHMDPIGARARERERSDRVWSVPRPFACSLIARSIGRSSQSIVGGIALDAPHVASRYMRATVMCVAVAPP